MSATYREFAPFPSLSPFVECFWTSEVERSGCRRILPDGCVDFIFFARRKRLVEAQIVGVMTRPHDVHLEAGQSIVGVRFHPGMAGAFLNCGIPAINDRTIPIQKVLGSSASHLIDGFDGLRSVESRLEMLQERLNSLPTISRVQQAIGELVGKRGQLSVADLANAAALGERQFRRTCLKHSGLSPKHLSRILRFRQAVSRIRQGEANMAGLAAECGFFDQAHMIRDFRELAGMSPGQFVRQQSR